jgi:hypothetical protein
MRRGFPSVAEDLSAKAVVLVSWKNSREAMLDDVTVDKTISDGKSCGELLE